MFRNRLNRKQLTVILLITAAMIAIISQSVENTQASIISTVMYFAPQRESRSASLNLQALIEVDKTERRYIQTVGSTGEWNVIQKLASQGELDALIIPHNAWEDVPWEELKPLFSDGLIVVGIGFPGDTLANLLGRPGLYTPQRRGDFDYHIYAMTISGHSADIQKLREAGFPDDPIEGIEYPLSVSRSSGGGYLSETENNADLFLGRLDDTIHAQNLLEPAN